MTKKIEQIVSKVLMKNFMRFLLAFILISSAAYSQTEVILERSVCLNEDYKEFTHDQITAPKSDNICNSGTQLRYELFGDANIASSIILHRSDATPHTATVDITFNPGISGILEVKISYRRKEDVGFFNCDWEPWKPMYTYRITRGSPNPGGILSGPSTLTSENTPSYVELTYSKNPAYTQTIPPIKFYVNGVFEAYASGNSNNDFLLAFNAETFGDYNVTTEIQNFCGDWLPGPSKVISVKPTCYQDDPAQVVIVPSGPELTQYGDGSYKVQPNQSYTLTVSGLTDFLSHYDWNIVDGGQDITFNGYNFTVTKNIGSYRIGAVPKAGRSDCPAPAPLQLVLGGQNVTLEQLCPIVFPEDLADFGYVIDPSNLVFQHFAVTASSQRSITVQPGITLELGAELILDAPEPRPVGDPTVNYIQSISYDEYGRVISNARSYFDERGLPLQTQYKNLTSEVVLANATLYDALGRQVISTLPAPVSASTTTGNTDECGEVTDPNEKIDFSFKPDFVKVSETANYKYTDFDVTNELSPLPVDGSQEGTLGWYYSANNGNSTNPRMNEPLVAITQYPYSRTLFHHDGSGAAKATTKPGDAFKAGGGHVGSSVNEPVSADDIYLDSYLDMREAELGFGRGPIQGEFFRTVLVDESGKKSIAYTDKSGNAIISLYFADQTTPITRSYKFYDQTGRLKVNVSPNGVAQYERTTNPVAFADIDKTTYFYNFKGLLTAVEETDVDRSEPVYKGRSEYVYRKDGKIRFSQNAKQRKAPQRYSYTNYDRSGRPVESGEYIIGSGGIAFKSAEMDNIIENTGSDGGLSNGTRQDRVQTFYDEPATGLPSQRTQRFVHGAVSYTKKDNYITTWYSYDEQGRVEWTVQQIDGLEGTKTIDYRYGPTGQVQEVLYQKGNASEQFSHFYEYDADGRLFKAYTTTDQLQYNKKGEVTNAGVLKLQATYFYYLHGPLKRVELAGNLQGIDYVYTADGALKSINSADPDPDSDPGKDGKGATPTFRKDVFGMTLDYYNNDYNATSNPLANITIPGTYPEQHGGLIRAMRWHSPIEDHQQVGYAYNYDQRNQFSHAGWGTINAGAFTNNILNAYKESISGYDLNGNIDELNRKNSDGTNIANFDYQYIANTNKLDKILDKDNNNAVIRDYDYNEIGELKSETGASEKYIDYDVTGKVTKVFRDAAKTKLAVSFLYDDRGFRLNKTSFDEEGIAQARTWYVRDGSGSVMGTYEHNLVGSNPMKLTELPVYASGRIGLFKPQFNYTQYELSDHLGNVRAVIGKPLDVEYLATMESERVTKESSSQQGDFDNLGNDVTATDFNHTPASVTVNGATEAIATPNEVDRLNTMPISGEPTSPVGTGIMLYVHPGDVIDAEVFVKYANFNSTNHNIVEGLAGFLTSAFSRSPIVDGPSIFNVVDEPGFAALPVWSKLNDDQPRAFLNYLLFDNNFKLQENGFDFDQVSSAAEITAVPSPHERLALEDIAIKKEGFLYIYVSNQSHQNMEVYFDDLRVKHTYSDIVGGADFYPFGLTIEDRQIQREFYRHGYQGKFAEKDEETGWSHFELREYDPVIGRWVTKDPVGQFYSPYIGMGNNPISGTDPDGGKNFKFDSYGNYIGKDHDVWWHNMLFGSRGVFVDANGEITDRFSFSDFVEDVKELEAGRIKKIHIVKRSDILELLVEAGAFRKENRDEAVSYLLTEGRGGGKFDFAHTGIYDRYPGSSPAPNHIPSRYLFLIGDVAYNQSNFGNFMFGAGVVTLGVPAPILSAMLGAHYNSLFNSEANGYPSQFDSKDDQWSIFDGARYSLQQGFNLKGR